MALASSLPSLAVADLVAHYPGPALVLDGAGAVQAANVVAREILDSEPGRLEELIAWVRMGGESPGTRSFPAEVRRGAVVVEWAATVLADGVALLLGRDATLERQLRHTLTESRRRYKDLVEVSSDFAWETGPDGRFIFITPKGALGYPVEALIGRDPRALVVEEWGDMPLPFDTRRPIEHTELWLLRHDGTQACVIVSALPLFGPHGQWTGARGVGRDITDQVEHAAELSRVRNREKLLAHIVHILRNRLDAAEALSLAAEEAARALGADGCRVYRVGEDGQFQATTAVGAAVRALPDEALTAILDEVARTPTPIAGLRDHMRLLACRTEHQQAVNGALAVWRSEATEPWDEEDRQLLAGVADHVGIAHAHVAYQERLRRLSERDGLTGLFNRRTFFERLEEQLGRAEQGDSTLLYVDLDNFKAVNDLHGHQAGDLALKAVGNLLGNGVRPGDLPGRLGGDEFVLWLGRTDEALARTVADRLLAGVQGLAHLSASPEKPLGLSIGIAVHHPGVGETVKELTDRADSAMYAAKARGKGNFALAPDYVPSSEIEPVLERDR